jgi:hypothetical protein
MQRRYQMPNRSRVTFWLLLLATLAVDAVMLDADRSNSNGTYSGVGLEALLLGQLSVVCIWSACFTSPSARSRVTPVLGVLLAALTHSLTTQYSVVPFFVFYLGYFGLHAVLVIASLWILQRTSYWRLKTGSSQTWQFSLFHALSITTVVAVLTTFMRYSGFLDDGIGNIAVTIGSVAIAVISVIIWRFSRKWIVALVGECCAVGLFGIATLAVYSRPALTRFDTDVLNIFLVLYLIQAIVISSWLAMWLGVPHGSGALESLDS